MTFTVPATQAIFDWITEHPYQTALHVVNGVVLWTPAALTVPFFSAIGFGTAGPAASMSFYFFYIINNTHSRDSPCRIEVSRSLVFERALAEIHQVQQRAA
jgi:hypothetical protein